MTAQIQIMETSVANFFEDAQDLILVQPTLLIQKIIKQARKLQATLVQNYHPLTDGDEV